MLPWPVYACVVLAAALFAYAKHKKPKLTNKNRAYGQWIPENYKTPEPRPYPHWDIEKTRPLPYRAFKHKYTITMGIRSMDWELWLELDNEWHKFHDSKLARLAEMGTDLYGTQPQAQAAVYELLDEFRQYLPKRYPSLFKQTKNGMENLATGEKFEFCNRKPSEDPMVMAAKMVQDDLAIMMEGPSGDYYLVAGAIILPGFWRLKDKFGLPLREIHTLGDVPKFKEKLQSGMEKFFIRLTCDKPVVRNNYFLQTDGNLAWSTSIGPEKENGAGWFTAEPATSPEQLYFRSERQSLRRLPKTGAIVFTIRTYFAPLTEICQEPYIPRRLLDGMSTWGPEVRQYKGFDKFKDAAVPYLEKMARKQEEAGFTAEHEPDVYPF